MLADVRVETNTAAAAPSAEPQVGPAAPIKGRSLWQDAGARFIRNRAALVSVIVLALIVVFTFVGPLVAAWSIEKIDWSVVGKVKTLGQPSMASGHYFGTDEVGRDLIRGSFRAPRSR